MSWIVFIVVAPFVGSFVGVLIQRLPEGRSIALHGKTFARSECASCHRPIRSYHLVPIVSYLVLKGRCSACQSPIGRFHLAVELAAMIVPIWVLLAERQSSLILSDCALGWTLIALSWIDLRHYVLPDALTLPLLVAGLVTTWWFEPEKLIQNTVGALLGYALLRGIAAGYRALRNQDGLGQGDAKLMAAAGAWVGWQNLSYLMLGAAVTGIALAALRGSLSSRDTAIPFGPCIALALWIIRIHGD